MFAVVAVFVDIGCGIYSDCAAILHALAATDLNCSIEMPLRLHRAPDAQPQRQPEPVPLAVLEAALGESLAFVKRQLGVPQENA